MTKSEPELKTILVVDDSPENLRVLNCFLVKYNYKVLVAKNGEEVLKKIKLIMPDIILLDIIMPGIDGFETCRHLKAQDRYRKIPVIFMTGLSETIDKVKGFELGAVDYITKPFICEDVHARIKIHIKLNELQKQLEETNLTLEKKVLEKTAKLERNNQLLIEDITKRKEVEEELRKSESNLTEAQKIAHLGSWEFDLKNRKFNWSEEVYRIFGIDTEKFNVTYETFLDMIHPDDRELIDRMYNDSEENCKPYDIIHRIIRQSDGEVRYVHKIGKHIKDKNNKVIRSFGTIHDISEQKQMQEEKDTLESQLRQAQKMEAVGTLAGGIAHDFNNILSPIIGFTELAMMDPSIKDSQTIKLLAKIYNASLRAKELVKQILSFSRQSEMKLQPIQPRLVIKEALKLLRSSIPSTIEIRTEIEEGTTILADPVQIHQIIMNLCTNAYHAMREVGGILNVSLSTTVINKDDIKVASLNITPGPYVKLVVSDTGCGMSNDLLEKIFDPYFTTKEKGEGTGLGLSVIHGIVKGYKGHISVYSEVGNGTTFNIYFPEQQSELQKQEKIKVSQLPTGTENVLIVDDDEAIGTVTYSILKQLGYKVEVFTSSTEALNAFIAKPNSFDLIITDMTMPQMTGIQLAQKVLSKRKNLPIILCTGFSSLITEEKAKDMGIKGFLLKPILMKELAKKVREVLDNSKGVQ